MHHCAQIIPIIILTRKYTLRNKKHANGYCYYFLNASKARSSLQPDNSRVFMWPLALEHMSAIEQFDRIIMSMLWNVVALKKAAKSPLLLSFFIRLANQLIYVKTYMWHRIKTLLKPDCDVPQKRLQLKSKICWSFSWNKWATKKKSWLVLWLMTRFADVCM